MYSQLSNRYRNLGIIVVVVLAISVTVAHAEIPGKISYQGWLTDDTGTPLDGAYLVKFTIYGSEDGTDSLWSSGFQTVQVDEGLFSYRLGSNVTITNDLFTGSVRYLGITVDPDPEIEPRTQFLAVPYAYHALRADSTDWNGLTNVPAGFADGIDDVGEGGKWTVTDSVIHTNNWWGIARGGAGNVLYGDGAHTMVNLGVACTTGADGYNRQYATAGGGYLNSASGQYATVGGGGWNSASDGAATVGGGGENSASSDAATVGGGGQNSASSVAATVGGGLDNSASGEYATVAGGAENSASGESATVCGGRKNVNAGDYSTIPGGYADTIEASADYSYLFGIGSSLTEDSTFMVDMPHIRFGNEASGYEFPTSDGTTDQVLATDGSGQLSWATHSTTWMVTDSVLYTSNNWGIARGGADNALYGNRAHTMVNLGVACTTGADGYNYQYATAGGGYMNSVSDDGVTVGGGVQNSASGYFATVGGGYQNSTSSPCATVGGGEQNSASRYCATVGGGEGNSASEYFATVGGGAENSASGEFATVGGGAANSASSEGATVGGGQQNSASSYYATVPGGYDNTAGGRYSFAAGRRAKADSTGAFVWADSINTDFSSSAVNGFHVRASGGVYMYTSSDLSTGVYLASGSGTWASVSDSTLKRNIREVDYRDMVDKVMALPISRWSYKTQDESIEHVGPMAQDFHRLFGLGEDDKHLTALDLAGVSLAAIKDLNEINQEQQTQLESQADEIAALRDEVRRLTVLVDGKAGSEHVSSE
jgi:hypothetical protein